MAPLIVDQMMKTKQRMERMQQLMKQVRQSVAFLLDQIEQLKEKQRRLQIEIESLHLSTRQERLGLRGELRDELLQLEWPWRKRCSGTPVLSPFGVNTKNKQAAAGTS